MLAVHFRKLWNYCALLCCPSLTHWAESILSGGQGPMNVKLSEEGKICLFLINIICSQHLSQYFPLLVCTLILLANHWNKECHTSCSPTWKAPFLPSLSVLHQESASVHGSGPAVEVLGVYIIPLTSLPIWCVAPSFDCWPLFLFLLVNKLVLFRFPSLITNMLFPVWSDGCLLFQAVLIKVTWS